MISNTENFAVIMLYPVSMDLGQMYQENMHPLRGMTPLEGPTRIYIMDLRLKYFKLYQEGTVCVISIVNYVINNVEDDALFLAWKLFISHNFFIVSETRNL